MLPAVLQRLDALGMPHRLIVAGDGPLRPWLVQRCPDAIFTGSIGREAVADVFASADLFLFPSRTDTAGNVVLEAQAAGLPVIVSDAGGPRENMLDGETGIVCNGSDPARWAAVAAGLLHDAALRHRMAGAARQYALTRRWDLALASVYDAYRAAARTDPRIVRGAPCRLGACLGKEEHAPSKLASPVKTAAIPVGIARVARLLGARLALRERAPSSPATLADVAVDVPPRPTPAAKVELQVGGDELAGAQRAVLRRQCLVRVERRDRASCLVICSNRR